MTRVGHGPIQVQHALFPRRPNTRSLLHDLYSQYEQRHQDAREQLGCGGCTLISPDAMHGNQFGDLALHHQPYRGSDERRLPENASSRLVPTRMLVAHQSWTFHNIG